MKVLQNLQNHVDFALKSENCRARYYIILLLSNISQGWKLGQETRKIAIFSENCD